MHFADTASWSHLDGPVLFCCTFPNEDDDAADGDQDNDDLDYEDKPNLEM